MTFFSQISKFWPFLLTFWLFRLLILIHLIFCVFLCGEKTRGNRRLSITFMDDVTLLWANQKRSTVTLGCSLFHQQCVWSRIKYLSSDWTVSDVMLSDSPAPQRMKPADSGLSSNVSFSTKWQHSSLCFSQFQHPVWCSSSHYLSLSLSLLKPHEWQQGGEIISFISEEKLPGRLQDPQSQLTMMYVRGKLPGLQLSRKR